MAVKSRNKTVIFMKDHALSPSISCHLLYGQERFDKNGDQIIYIDGLAPMEENNITLNQMPSKHTYFNGSKFILLGLVCNNNHLDHVRFLEILKQQQVKSGPFCILVVSINEIFRGKSLVLIHEEYSSEETPLEFQSCIIIDNMRKTEVRIVCLKRNLSLSKLSWLYPMDSDKTVGKKQTVLKHFLNGNYIKGDQVNTSDEYCTRSSDSSHTRDSNSSALTLLSLIFLSVSWCLSLVQPSLKFPTIIKQCLGYLSKYLFVAKQLSYRFDQLYDMFVDREESCQQVDISSKSIANGNLVISLLVDVILGFLVIYFVFSSQQCLSISSWLIGQKYIVAERLLTLLKWLMGAPAGLKLNIPLNQFLGNFYIYHVYLWTNYLYFIEAYLPTIILCCTLAGCLGVTFLLALLCDVLSLLTVHIYCFYIYAARLFCLEIHILASLLRLFTGKKWNFLRSRVDSVEYDVDRLFIGTLLFTILLFLFPTIFLYYIVFTGLRLLVILVQSSLYGLVALFSSFPFFGLWLYFVNPEKLPGQIIVDTKTLTSGLEDCFNIENANVIQPDYCLYLSFRHECVPCGNLFNNCRSVMFKTTYQDIFGEGILHKLLTGQIISKR